MIKYAPLLVPSLVFAQVDPDRSINPELFFTTHDADQLLCEKDDTVSGPCHATICHKAADAGYLDRNTCSQLPGIGRSMAFDGSNDEPDQVSNNDTDTVEYRIRDTKLGLVLPLQEEDTPTSRFGLLLQIPVINNYGCWCHGGEFWPGARDQSGKGQVMDVYDDACKAHHMGYDCIAADAVVEDRGVCKPSETMYTLLIKQKPNGSFTIECDDDIYDDWCKRRVCMVDIRFLSRQFTLQQRTILPDYTSFGHPGYHGITPGNANFDEAASCVRSAPGGFHGVQKTCCGDYPYRIWYNPESANTQCCEYADASVIQDYGFALNVGALFNPTTQTCCDDGVENASSCPGQFTMMTFG